MEAFFSSEAKFFGVHALTFSGAKRIMADELGGSCPFSYNLVREPFWNVSGTVQDPFVKSGDSGTVLEWSWNGSGTVLERSQNGSRTVPAQSNRG